MFVSRKRSTCDVALSMSLHDAGSGRVTATRVPLTSAVVDVPRYALGVSVAIRGAGDAVQLFMIDSLVENCA